MKTRQRLFIFIAFMLAATSSADDDSKEEDDGPDVINSGKTPTVFVELGKGVKLKCKSSSSSEPQWSFQNLAGKTTRYCEQSDDGDSKTASCKVSLEKIDDDVNESTLELMKTSEGSFGTYICHAGNSANQTFNVIEKATIARKSKTGKTRKSVTIVEGDRLNLYCNVSGFNKQQHQVSWFKGKDGNITDITDELQNASGLFLNFTKEYKDNESYVGTANVEHRDYYTCQIDLANEFVDPGESKKIRQPFPVNFTFFVRVQDAGRWQYPVYILIVEVVVIALFTYIINRKERGSDEADGDYEDSDDEDEVQPEKNGASSCNKNGN